jgi:hypothetical protein
VTGAFPDAASEPVARRVACGATTAGGPFTFDTISNERPATLAFPAASSARTVNTQLPSTRSV